MVRKHLLKEITLVRYLVTDLKKKIYCSFLHSNFYFLPAFCLKWPFGYLGRYQLIQSV